MSEYDGIHNCVFCGEYTIGMLCSSCLQQKQIDESIEFYDEYNDSDYIGFPYWLDNYDCDNGDDFDYDDFGWEYEHHPETLREKVKYFVYNHFTYRMKLWVNKMRYRYDRKYREWVDEIPF